MAKDLLIDIDKHDVIFRDVTNNKVIVYDTKWGVVFDGDDADETTLSIIVPLQYRKKIKYDTEGVLVVKANVAYLPVRNNIKVRFLTEFRGMYEKLEPENGPKGEHALLCCSASSQTSNPPLASELPLLNVDGYFSILFFEDDVMAEIFSGKESDFYVQLSDNQTSKLLTICAPGKLYRYPTTGVSIFSYLNSVIAHSDLAEKLNEQFGEEDRTIFDASFDNMTGELDLNASPELTEKDANLTDIEDMDYENVGIITGNDFSDLFMSIRPDDILFKEIGGSETIKVAHKKYWKISNITDTIAKHKNKFAELYLKIANRVVLDADGDIENIELETSGEWHIHGQVDFPNFRTK